MRLAQAGGEGDILEFKSSEIPDQGVGVAPLVAQPGAPEHEEVQVAIVVIVSPAGAVSDGSSVVYSRRQCHVSEGTVAVIPVQRIWTC